MPERTPLTKSIARRCVVVVAALVIVACDSTAMRLLVVAELAVPDDVNALVVTVTGNGEEISSSYALEERADSLRESVTLLPGDEIRDELHVDVVGLLQGEVVARGDSDGRFRTGEITEVVVALAAPAPPSDGGPAGDAGPEVTDAGVVVVDAGLDDCIDDDGDGYGDGPGCLGFDCDENDDSVHEGAAELCNGVDDDCDFAIDEGCECVLGQSRGCGTLEGQCQIGVQICATGTWGGCEGARLPEPETCNGEDDDCDGAVDEGCP